MCDYELLKGRIQEILGQLDASGCVEIDEEDLLAIGAAIAAARQGRVEFYYSSAARAAEALWRRAMETFDEEGAFAISRLDVEALRALDRLLEAVQPVAAGLDTQRARGTLWVLVNPAHPQGTTILTNNDTGVYDDPWEALADLAEAWREYDNPYIYLGHVMSVF